MRISKVHLTIVSFTSSIVLVLATVIVAGISSWNPGQQVSLNVDERKPASLVDLESVSQAVDAMEKSTTFALDCITSGKLAAPVGSAKQIRLVGKLCGQKISDSHVVNRTNGIEAITFKFLGENFSTDYIDLVPGANQIFVKVENETGESTLTEVTVVRESTQSN